MLHGIYSFYLNDKNVIIKVKNLADLRCSIPTSTTILKLMNKMSILMHQCSCFNEGISHMNIKPSQFLLNDLMTIFYSDYHDRFV